MPNRTGSIAALLLALAGSACTGVVRDAAPMPDSASHDLVGVAPVHLDAEYWVRKQASGDEVVLDSAAIAAQNARLRASDPSVNDIERLPAELERARVRAWIEALSQAPAASLFDSNGNEVSSDDLAALRDGLALDAIPERQPTRFGLVTHRADLRTFPTTQRVFNTRGDTQLDRFQESALFPGTPVAIVHASRDGNWWFVVSDLYEAWIEKRFVALGSAEEVFGYARKHPFIVVTGADVRTTFNPAKTQVSQVALDMGVRVPLLVDWPENRPVNGQHAYAAHVIELPVRDTGGAVVFVPALLPRGADVAEGYLPFSRDALLRQGFKFLGEHYGWGHSDDARDCSGFVSEVYRSFGVILPRNTGDQAISPAFDRIAFDRGMGRAQRIAVLRTLDAGDLIYIPGHVMMLIGFEDGMPYVIHDTLGINYQSGSGRLERIVLDGVAVTPLAPLMVGAGLTTIDAITSVQRIRR